MGVLPAEATVFQVFSNPREFAHHRQKPAETQVEPAGEKSKEPGFQNLRVESEVRNETVE
jgi:hypothetical protein